MEIGIYGKLPSNGDFLMRRVPQEFLHWWDNWLQHGVAASREQLGGNWLDIFLTSPIWRFYFEAGTVCSRPCVGLVTPSVDRVGRYFPLTLVWFPEGSASFFSLARHAAPWFNAAERHVVEALEAEQSDFASFDQKIRDSGALLDAADGPDDFALQPEDAAALLSRAYPAWQLPLKSLTEMRAVAEHLAGSQLRNLGARCYFWTEGSGRVAPSMLVGARFPDPADYMSLLTGEWAGSSWTPLDAQLRSVPSMEDTAIRIEVPVRYESGSRSDTGNQRKVNQDALLERAELGLWVVADGMGGHSDGELASRMVCDALAEMLPPPSVEQGVEAIQSRLQSVNDYLFRMASREIDPKSCGSTVVVMLARGSQAAILWAGDSRVYRLRNGELRQVTEDHSWDDPESAATGEGTAITRAVGGTESLQLDLRLERTQPGDRYLLCSDGVTRELTDERIRELLATGDAASCSAELLRAVLLTPAQDNASAIVIDAVADLEVTAQ
jgi:type VI secretion system protein ImpM